MPIEARARRNTLAKRRNSQNGFTLLEMAFVMLIIGVMTMIAVPQTKAALKGYHLGAAVQAVSGAIQGARYSAISHGATYNVAFGQTTFNYQVGTKVAPATTFSNVGNPIPWSTSNDVTLSPSTTLEFSPGGTVKATTGTLNLTLTDGTKVETITVSEVGNISVSP